MGKTQKMKAAVSLRALLQRVNRKLANEEELIRRTRPIYDVMGGDTEHLRPIYDHNLGQFYRIDTRRNFVVETHVDLEAIARKLGAIAPWEQLEE
jgi:hypothetical protein